MPYSLFRQKALLRSALLSESCNYNGVQVIRREVIAGRKKSEQ